MTGYPVDVGRDGVPGVEVRRVGPGGSMAADNAFAIALLTLWHRVAEAGGVVGFAAPVDRAEVGGAVAEVISRLRSGRAVGLALTRRRDVIGFAMLDRGTRTQAHTGKVTVIMVDPGSQRTGLGLVLMQSTLDLASSMGVERIRLEVSAGVDLERFFERFGFFECGRSPGWSRISPGEDHDEVMMTAQLLPGVETHRV